MTPVSKNSGPSMITSTLLADRERLHRSREPSTDKNWFLFQLSASADHRIDVGCFSVWAGQSKDRPRRELRKPRVVYPIPCIRMLQDTYERPLVVDDDDSLLIWVLLGGVALITEDMAREVFPEDCEPHEVGRVASRPGFIGVDGLPKAALRRAPTPKVRVEVLLRDKRRCRLCGRSADEDVHAHLESHHGIPWGGGHSGLTLPENLFTLCKTCHIGLPKSYLELLDALDARPWPRGDAARASYFEEVGYYREAIAIQLRPAQTRNRRDERC